MRAGAVDVRVDPGGAGPVETSANMHRIFSATAPGWQLRAQGVLAGDGEGDVARRHDGLRAAGERVRSGESGDLGARAPAERRATRHEALEIAPPRGLAIGRQGIGASAAEGVDNGAAGRLIIAAEPSRAGVSGLGTRGLPGLTRPFLSPATVAGLAGGAGA